MEFEPREIDPPNDGIICTKKLAKSKGVPSFCECKKCSQERKDINEYTSPARGIMYGLAFIFILCIIIILVFWALFNH